MNKSMETIAEERVNKARVVLQIMYQNKNSHVIPRPDTFAVECTPPLLWYVRMYWPM